MLDAPSATCGGIFFIPIWIDYDPAKSEANRDKHGIDFEEAKALWADALMLTAPGRTDDEKRFLTIGKIDSKCWCAVWTPRGDRVRLISVRRARKDEVDVYEG